LIKAAKRVGIPTWATAILILLIGFGGLGLAAMALAKPVSEWIARAPEIGASIKDKLAVLDQPLAALQQLETSLFGDSGALKVNASGPNVVLPVVAFVTPAAGELVLFFTTLLFFLVGQIDLRNQAVALFGSKDSKLRFLKIMRDIERNLAAYLTVVTIVNVSIAIIVSLGAWVIGFPNPLIFETCPGAFAIDPLLIATGAKPSCAKRSISARSSSSSVRWSNSPGDPTSLRSIRLPDKTPFSLIAATAALSWPFSMARTPLRRICHIGCLFSSPRRQSARGSCCRP